jgi:hypothetical protein
VIHVVKLKKIWDLTKDSIVVSVLTAVIGILTLLETFILRTSTERRSNIRISRFYPVNKR